MNQTLIYQAEELPSHLTMILEVISFPNYAFFSLMFWELLIVLAIQWNDTVKV